MTKKYVILKDDDVGKDMPNLKRWVNIVTQNDAKGSIGVIGKYLKKREIAEYLNSLDKNKIEIFCHGYSHSHITFLLRKVIGRNKILPTEFDRNSKSHNKSLKKYRELEKQLNVKSVVFGPPGNIWNDTIIQPLINNDFKIMFSWEQINGNIFKIPLCDNLRQNSLDEYIKIYEKNSSRLIYTLQFHHANMSDKQFEHMTDVIDFLKNKEKRVFIKPSELIEISKKDKNILKILSS